MVPWEQSLSRSILFAILATEEHKQMKEQTTSHDWLEKVLLLIFCYILQNVGIDKGDIPDLAKVS